MIEILNIRKIEAYEVIIKQDYQWRGKTSELYLRLDDKWILARNFETDSDSNDLEEAFKEMHNVIHEQLPLL